MKPMTTIFPTWDEHMKQGVKGQTVQEKHWTKSSMSKTVKNLDVNLLYGRKNRLAVTYFNMLQVLLSFCLQRS